MHNMWLLGAVLLSEAIVSYNLLKLKKNQWNIQQKVWIKEMGLQMSYQWLSARLQ